MSDFLNQVYRAAIANDIDLIDELFLTLETDQQCDAFKKALLINIHAYSLYKDKICPSLKIQKQIEIER